MSDKVSRLAFLPIAAKLKVVTVLQVETVHVEQSADASERLWALLDFTEIASELAAGIQRRHRQKKGRA